MRHARLGDFDGVMMQNWQQKRVLILGAARQGQALARYLSEKGAVVTVNDRQSIDALQPIMDNFPKNSVRWVGGGHPLELLDGIDLLCLSGGVSLDLPLVQEALKRGIAVSNDTQIFLEAVPCPVIGITGSAGKTTTTTLVGRMAALDVFAPRKSWVGGNIGFPLISHLDEMGNSDLVVMEVSSFQLEQMTISPRIAAVLNITPNHLDRHGTMEAYTATKARMIQFQTSTDTSVLNREDPGSWGLLPMVKGNLVSFGKKQPSAATNGTFAADGWVCYQDQNQIEQLLPISSILLRGEHNLVNVLAASAIAKAAGFSNASIHAGIDGFTGVAHRLEWVREWKGTNWYNDSIATAPERAMAAIRSFSEPIVLLAGGRDKNLPWDQFAQLVQSRVRVIVTFGEAASLIEKAVKRIAEENQTVQVIPSKNLQQAVNQAARVCQPGDVVLLSPGGTSYDEFKDFEERGEVFRTWVQQLS
jgi:UDP-N-acetylmuramoylalanine--D-glutamate ligase